VADVIGELCEVVHSGISDAEPVRPLRAVVLMAQRLEGEKHTEDALGAWRTSRLGEEGWRLQIAGQGSQRASLERIVEQNSLVGVEFLGQRSDLASLRGKSSVLLATTPREAFGLSVVEAMAAGLPVVAADGGAHRETVGACEPSLLYPPGDTDACARVLRRLADDVAGRCDIGARLRDYQQAHLRLADHVDQLERIYREVTS
jgi:glycosyltransferase involved in cell wall biosynthesis